MRQFISSAPLAANGTITVCGKDFRYLRQVLRIKCGDMVSVRLPDGYLQNMTVCSISEKEKSVILQKCDVATPEQNGITRGVTASEIENSAFKTEYWLFQFIAKPAKMEQIIKQATECGVKYIVPVAGEFSQKQNIEALNSTKKDRIERINRIIREARQQSGSPVETQVLEVQTVQQAAELWSATDSLAVVLWERSEQTCSIHQAFAQKNKNQQKIALAVGCEGGISTAEIAILQQNGFVPVHIAGNILRCETAALYGIAAVQSAVEKSLME